MVEIVDGLKAKLVEIDTQIELLRRQIGDLDDQRAAFVKVIRVYEPEFTSGNAAPRRPRSAPRRTASSRVTELLKGKNNRHVVLDILRRSDRPTSSAEIARQFATDIELGEEAERLETALASRFSATLDGLQKQGLVKHAGTVDGRRHLWEISR
ncbi:hypothetical protein [Ciceribacter selenitireducens]|uniref:hypothetical protein n=1 Tax=Ciceribacter selenitireducens TaxID=448181 RepID=UPI0004ADECD9|nr:hypothetical protein [Ciceribacter selenitireducens]